MTKTKTGLTASLDRNSMLEKELIQEKTELEK